MRLINRVLKSFGFELRKISTNPPDVLWSEDGCCAIDFERREFVIDRANLGMIRRDKLPDEIRSLQRRGAI